MREFSRAIANPTVRCIKFLSAASICALLVLQLLLPEGKTKSDELIDGLVTISKFDQSIINT